MARVLIEHGARPEADLRELCSRIEFNMLVSNTDHLRTFHPDARQGVAPVGDLRHEPRAARSCDSGQRLRPP